MSAQGKSSAGEGSDNPDPVRGHDQACADSHPAPTMIPVSPTVTRLSGFGLGVLSQSQPKPGNAFAGLKHRETEGSKLPRKSGGASIVKSPVEVRERPVISRKASNLDYNEDLALPMPKPRHIRADPAEVTSPLEEDKNKSHLLRKRCITDPAVSTVPESLPLSVHDGKKKSRLDVLRSKLSFKDLRKECTRDEVAPRATTPSMEDPKARTRWGVSTSNIPSFSPSTHGLKSRPQPMPNEQSKSSTSTSTTNSTTSQVTFAPTRIPLPPSSTFSNIEGTIAPPKSLTNRQLSSLGAQAQAPTDSSSGQDKSDLESNREMPLSTEGLQPDIVVTRPSLETSQKRYKVRSPSTPSPTLSRYPVTMDSPPSIGDLCEGEGKVKYLPKDWLDGSFSLPPQTKKHPNAPSLSSENEAYVNSPPEPLLSFKERLQKANISLSQPASPDVRSTAMQVDDVVDMARSIQRQADSGISCMSKKLEDLSAWIGDQLKNQIESVSDLGRANSDLFTKQCQISRDMMKFQLDIRLEIGVMDKRLNDFESKILDEFQSELRALARSYEETNRRIEAAIEKLSSGDTPNFIELQHQKIAEIESEIAYIKARQSPSTAIAPFQAHLLHAPSRPSESSNGSTEPLIRQAPSLPPVPPLPTSPTRARVVSLPENKALPMFPRSVSLTKKGFLKGIKDMASLSPEKEKAPDKAKSSEDPKKWNVFGFRRRRDQGENPSSSTKFSWSSSRRTKDAHTVELSSSRSSSPPIPSIVRNIAPTVDNHTNDTSNIHPAFRNAPQQATSLEDGSMTTSLDTSVQPSTAAQSHSHEDAHSAEVARVTSTNKPQSQTTSFHTGVQGSSSTHSSNDDAQKAQLLGESVLNSQEWDRISSHEQDSPN